MHEQEVSGTLYTQYSISNESYLDIDKWTFDRHNLMESVSDSVRVLAGPICRWQLMPQSSRLSIMDREED